MVQKRTIITVLLKLFQAQEEFNMNSHARHNIDRPYWAETPHVTLMFHISVKTTEYIIRCAANLRSLLTTPITCNSASCHRFFVGDCEIGYQTYERCTQMLKRKVRVGPSSYPPWSKINTPVDSMLSPPDRCGQINPPCPQRPFGPRRARIQSAIPYHLILSGTVISC